MKIKFLKAGHESPSTTSLFWRHSLHIQGNKLQYEPSSMLIPPLKSDINQMDNMTNTRSVYQLKYLSCEQVYIGQTGREFRTRYKEHIRDKRFNQTKSESKYAQHILECNHKYGKIEDAMEVIQTAQKGRHLDAQERFYIYKACKNKPILNERYGTDTNVLFDSIINIDKNKCSNK
jgi:hypothetical protein